MRFVFDFVVYLDFQVMDKQVFASIISFAIYGCLFLFIGFLLFG